MLSSEQRLEFMHSDKEDKIHTIEGSAYSLLDSGLGEKLEQYGDKIIRRPSSLALWNKTQPETIWVNADAHYDPNSGWHFKTERFEHWLITIGAFQLKLLLQDNGQVGIFPEHLSYFMQLKEQIERIKMYQSIPRVLNLFAYTGMATLWCALLGTDVTHIELSKKVLSWANDNLKINRHISSSIRFIPEDAIIFIEREAKRGNHYDIIIADPPSFSRVSKSQSWNLEQVVSQLIKNSLSILAPHGSIFFSSHHHVLNPYSLENLFLDYHNTDMNFKRFELTTQESQGKKRVLYGGSLLIAQGMSQN